MFHTNLLTLAPSNPLPGQRNPPPEPVVFQDQDEWELENILDSKKIRGRLKYRVKWTGWDDDQHWYDADNGEFDNARDIVNDFHRRYPNKPR